MYTKSNSPWLNDSKLPYRQLLSCLKFINTVRNWLHFLKYKYDTGIPVLKISDLSSGINLQLKGRAFHSRKNIPLVFNKHYYKLIQKVTKKTKKNSSHYVTRCYGITRNTAGQCWCMYQKKNNQFYSCLWEERQPDPHACRPAIEPEGQGQVGLLGTGLTRQPHLEITSTSDNKSSLC